MPDLAAAVFAATLKMTLPVPLPEVAAPSVIQPALLLTIQPHPPAVVTLMVPEEAAPPKQCYSMRLRMCRRVHRLW